MSVRRVPRCTRAYDPQLREAVGAYLLGGLEPAEADEVSAHLSECESCRGDYAELADLVPLMALVTEKEAVNGPVRPEPAVLSRVIASSRRQREGGEPAEQREARPARPARSHRTRFALAAACVVLAAGGSAIGMRMATHASVPAAWSATVVVPNQYQKGDITAVADVTPASIGSHINLKMEGVPLGYKCSMVVRGADGHSETTGPWTAAAGGSFTIPATSSFAPDKVASIDVDLPDGSILMHIVHP